MVSELMPGFPKTFARFEQRFARDAANPQTGAAESRFLFHTSYIQPELRRADRSHISARPRPNNDQIMLRHKMSSCSVVSRSSDNYRQLFVRKGGKKRADSHLSL